MDKNKKMENEIKNIYHDNLLSCNDIIGILNDLRNDNIIERELDVDCLTENLIDLLNDNVEIIVNDIINVYEKYGGIK